MHGLLRMICSTVAAATLACVLTPAARAGEAEDKVLAEVNFARAHPQDYARRLMLQPVSGWERSLSPAAAEHDPGAYAEAIAFLMRQEPLPPLQADGRLAAAADEHVQAQGPAGQIGHNGAAGERFDQRLRRHGVKAEALGENIAYGPARPSDVVRELIIDSGVPDRGHRRNIFYEAFGSAGVRCGPHRDYATMCVMEFASPPFEAQRWSEASVAPDGASAGAPDQSRPESRRAHRSAMAEGLSRA